MNATEKYIFDLNGYIIVPQVSERKRPEGDPTPRRTHRARSSGCALAQCDAQRA